MKAELPSTLLSVGNFLNAAIRWWLKGLSDLWPKAFQSFISKTRPVVWQLDLPLTHIDFLETALNTCLTEKLHIGFSASPIAPSVKTTPLLISLHETDILSLKLLLPTSAQFKLQEAVSFQLISEAPLPRAELYFDSRVVRRIDKHRIEVRVDICKKEIVQTLAAWLEQQGFINVTIGVAAIPATKLDSVFHTSKAIKSARSRSRKTFLLAVSVVLSLLAFSPLLYTAVTLKTRRLNHQNNELQHKVNSYADLLAQRSLQETITIDLKKQLPRYPLTNALNQVASLMPDTAWLTSIRFDQGVMQLGGNAENPTDMMKDLAHLSEGQVKLVSVTNQPNSSTPAQFEISVQLPE